MKNSNSVTCDLKDVFSVFDTATSAADIIAAKALAGISAGTGIEEEHFVLEFGPVYLSRDAFRK